MNTQEERFPQPTEQNSEQGSVVTQSREQEIAPSQTTATAPEAYSQWQTAPPLPPPRPGEPFREAGYFGGPGPQPIGTSPFGPPMPQPPRRRRSPWVVITIVTTIVLLLIGITGMFVFGLITEVGNVTSTETRHFSMSGHPQIVVTNDTGSIHIRGESIGNEVTVQVTKWRFGGNTDDIQIVYNQSSDGSAITVKGVRAPNILNGTTAAIDVTVPSKADLQLTTNTGELWSTGVSGRMSLSSNTGSITVRDGLLQANSSLTTNTGSVTFQGTIEREGSYQFLTDTGSVNVTVPSEAAFHVDASTTTGSITTAFPGVIVTRQNFTGSEAHGDVGSLPRAIVTMRTTTGSINLQEGS